MSHPCDSCGSPQVDAAYVCPDCAARTDRDLTWLAANAAELDVVITRQSRIGTGTGGGTEIPLPLDLNASYTADDVRNVLTTWARDLMDGRAIHGPADTIAGCAAWITGQLNILRARPYAEKALDELSDAVARVRRAVDSHVQRVYRGPCGASTDTGPCAEELYAVAHAETIRCRSCDTEHDSAARRERLLGAVRDQIVPACDITTAIQVWADRDLDSSTVRKWAERGRLVRRGWTRDGRPTYRVGDALALADTSPHRDRKRLTNA